MITHLSTYHDIRSIGIIRAFVEQTAHFFGADTQERGQLELAAEEAAAFIINALIPDRDEHFTILCEPLPYGLRFCFRIKGLPVDEENLPAYDSQNPTDSMEGLPFFLIESLTDAIRFHNLGNEGWELVFEKRLKRFSPPVLKREDDAALLKRCAKEKLTITLARPEDAYDLNKLTYFTYRYSYVKEIFYYKERLKKALAEGKIIAFIGKNSQNEVVINSAFFRSEHSPAIAEAGMLMSRPEYRMNRALLRLTRMQHQFVTERKSDLRVLYANLVTSHTKSQRLLSAYHFLPMALKLSVHPKAEFIGMETETDGRESLLYALSAPNGFDPFIVYVPPTHESITTMLLQEIPEASISISTATAQGETKGEITKYHEDRHGVIVIDVVGEDWVTWLRAALHECDSDGLITIRLHLPAHRPLPEKIDTVLTDEGLFFSGLTIKTMQQWELTYTLLRGQRFDFDAIALSDTVAIKLRDYMHEAYRRLKGY